MRGKTNTATVRTMALQRKTPAGLADPASPPSVKAIQRHVFAGICPFCGLGPYKLLASHTNRAHAVDRKELRERAGLTYRTSIISDEDRATKSANAKRAYEAGVTLTAEMRALAIGVPRKVSSAGKEINRQKLAAVRIADPESQARASAASHAKKAVEMRPIYELAAATYDAVLAERGMAYGSVIETARRLGWREGTTVRRIETAWRLGIGNPGRGEVAWRRGDEERRICRVCGTQYLVTRDKGGRNKTCSRVCGAKLAAEGSKKPPRVGTCKICQSEFTYTRPGTTERSICDDDECRRELSRRAGRRTPSEATRRKISASRRHARSQ